MNTVQTADELATRLVTLERRLANRGAATARVLAPLLVVLGLGLGYLLLDGAVPLVRANVGHVPYDVQEHWSAPIWALSEAVQGRVPAAFAMVLIAGVGALILAGLSRRAAYSLYVVGTLLVVADLVVLFGPVTWIYAGIFGG